MDIKQYKVSDLSRYEVDGIDFSDYPSFCDAHISRAWNKDWKELTDEELEQLYENDPSGVYEAIYAESVEKGASIGDFLRALDGERRS